MKNLLMVLGLLFVTSMAYSQKIGYELRTNGKSYIATAYGGFELRHRTDLKENRFTYRYNVDLGKKVVFSLPLHYKIEKEQPTLEPRLIYKFTKFKLWVQKEFSASELFNTAIAVDVPVKDFTYRIGWDDSNTIRFRLMRKF